MNSYSIQTAVRMKDQFINVLTGQPADPSSVVLYVLDPHATRTLYVYGTDPVVRDGIGAYHFDVIVTVSGTWTYKWQGTGTVVATSPDTQFMVTPSVLIAG
jgi:hypothetical protein